MGRLSGTSEYIVITLLYTHCRNESNEVCYVGYLDLCPVTSTKYLNRILFLRLFVQRL